MLFQWRSERVKPVRRAQEKLQRTARHHVLDAHRNDGYPPADRSQAGMSNSRARGLASSRASWERSWDAYDRLPSAVKLAFQEAVINWSAVPLLREWRRGTLTTADAVRRVRKWDAEYLKDHRGSSQRGARRGGPGRS